MKNSDYILCKYQGELFEYSINYLNCSSSYFFKKFMNSDVAKRMDKNSFINESIDYPALLDDLKKETDLSRGNKKSSREIMRWVGFLSRYWSIKYRISSKRIYSIIHLDEFERLYEAYHSLDVEEAIDRINEAKNVKYISDKEYVFDIAMKVINENSFYNK